MNGFRYENGPFRDTDAGDLLAELRQDLGLSPEEVPHAMLKAGVVRKNIPSARTIRRAEEGVRPHIRHRFAIAGFYGRPMGSIWVERSRVAA